MKKGKGIPLGTEKRGGATGGQVSPSPVELRVRHIDEESSEDSDNGTKEEGGCGLFIRWDIFLALL